MLVPKWAFSNNFFGHTQIWLTSSTDLSHQGHQGAHQGVMLIKGSDSLMTTHQAHQHIKGSDSLML